jgi:hypothetical protein
MNPHNYTATQAHWDALADILGEGETTRLYGPRPELYNSAQCVEKLYFNDKAPRRAVYVAIALGLVLAVLVPYRAIHRRAEVPTVLEPCALVLTTNGQQCR